MKKFLALPLLLLTLTLFAACSKKAGGEGAEAAKAAGATRLVLLQNGDLLFDDEKIGIDELPERVGEVKARDGEIWYHRAGPRGERPPEAMQVLNVLVAAQVPVQLYEDIEFTRPLSMNSGNAPPLR